MPPHQPIAYRHGTARTYRNLLVAYRVCLGKQHMALTNYYSFLRMLCIQQKRRGHLYLAYRAP